jgi:hypothetical protein
MMAAEILRKLSSPKVLAVCFKKRRDGHPALSGFAVHGKAVMLVWLANFTA